MVRLLVPSVVLSFEIGHLLSLSEATEDSRSYNASFLSPYEPHPTGQSSWQLLAM